MDKHRFLSELEYELRALGTDEDELKKRVGQFEKFFSTLPEDEIAETLDGLGNAADVAMNIKALAGSKSEENVSAANQSTQNEEDTFADIPSALDEGDIKESKEATGINTERKAVKADESDRIADTESRRDTLDSGEKAPKSFFDDYLFTASENFSDKSAQHSDKNESDEDDTKYIDINKLRDVSRDEAQSGIEDNLAQTASIDSKRLKTQKPGRPDKYSPVPHRIELDFNELDMGEDEVKPTIRGQVVFIVGAILTLPITLPLMLILLILIGGVFAVISVTIAVLVAVLVAVVIAGVAIPLIGIIFGIIKAYTVFSAGLYEIGLGIAVAGIAMFLGILIYNFAVRFLPFVLKKFAVFAKFVLRSIGALIKRIRKECVTL